MSVLSRLFGRKSQPETRENKITSLEAMAPEALMRIAMSDTKSETDDRLRLAAVQKLTDEKSLSALAFDSPAPNIQRTARQRLAALIDADQLDFAHLDSQLNDPLKLFSIMSFSQQPQRLDQLLATLKDQEALYQVASGGATAKLRQLAAEKLTDKDLLQQLVKDAKGKDKTVYKIAKDKCDQFKEEEKLLAATQASISALAIALEQHSHRPFDAHYAAKFHHLQSQWQGVVESAPTDTQHAAQAAIERCQSLIDSMAAAEAEASAKALGLASADQTRQEILQALAELARSLLIDAGAVENVDAQLADLNLRWRAALANKDASAHEQKNFVRLSETVPALQQQFVQFGSIEQHTEALTGLNVSDTPEDEMPSLYYSLKKRLLAKEFFPDHEIPQVLLDAQAAVDHWDRRSKDKKAEFQNTQRHIGGLIRKATDSAQAGRFQQAAGLRRAVEEKLALLEKIPTHLLNQVEQLDDALAKLQDWKDYAVVPKKHQLIEQMKALLDSKDHPEGLANKIKRLQDEWKGLSKGGALQKDGHDQVLWEEFHQLAQNAYQPCRDYFAAQAAIRQKNLESCKLLVDQLALYCRDYDWQNADWKAVEKVLHTARQEWRSYSPTERAATQVVQAEFDRLLEVIEQKLGDERNNNVIAKQNLIVQAQNLVELVDPRKAVDEVKRLQGLWQKIGVIPRALDQKLWREFRAACDAVFTKRQQQSAEFKEELDANLNQAEALVVEVRTVTELNGQALNDARKSVDELRQSFNNLGPLPKNKSEEIKTAFAQALETFEQKIVQERNAAKQQVWVNLFEANNRLRLVQLELLAINNEAEREPVLEHARAQLSTFGSLPNGGLKAIEHKLELAEIGQDFDANQIALRLLCIRAEILTGSATPDADQALRMAYQVKQLEQNFGQRPQDIRTEFDTLIFEWIANGPIATKDYEPLFKRFYATWQKAFK